MERTSSQWFKVLAEVDRIRRGGSDFATAKWTANQLARTY